MAISAGAIALDLGLNTAPISRQIQTAATGVQTQLGSAFKGANSQMGGAFKNINSQTDKTVNSMQTKFSALFGKLGAMLAAAFAISRIKALAQEWMSLYQTQIQSEIQIAVTMRNATNATLEEIQAVKDLASEYQQLGVIGDEVQLAGMQELATYVSEAESVKKIMPVLNDMVAQQYGYDASSGAAVGIATMLGKVLNGNTTALSRYGYDFTDEQANIIKYGTEAEKVATVTEVIEESVANMNEALAQTPTGKIKQLSNNFGDMKEALGNVVTNICQPFVSVLNVIVVKLTAVFNALARASAALLSIKSFSFLGLGQSASSVSESIDGITASAEGAGSAMKSLMGFDQLNRLDGGSGGGGSDDDGGDVPSIIDEEQLANDLARMKQFFDQCMEVFKSYFKDIPKLEINIDEKKLKENLKSSLLSIAQILGAWGSFFITIGIDIANDLDIGELINNLSDLTAAGLSLGAAISNAVTPALIEFYQAGISPVVEWIGGKLADAMSFFSGIAGSWAAWFTDNREKIVSFGKALGDAVGTIEEFLEPIGNAAWETFKTTISAISDALQVFGDWFLNNSDAVCAALTAIVAGMIAYKTTVAISSIITALTTAMTGLSVAQGLVTVAQEALNAVMTMNPIGLIVAAIAAAVAAFLYFWNTSEGFRNFWTGLWDGIKTAAAAVIDWLKSALSSAGDFFVNLWDGIENGATAVADFFSGIWTSITTAVSTAWNAVTEFLSPAVEWFTTLFTGIYDALASIISVIADIILGLWEIIQRVFEVVSDWFNETVIEPVAQFFSDLWGGISDTALNAWSFIKDTWEEASTWLNDTIITPVSEFFRGLWENVTSGAGGAWEGIKSVFSAVASFFETTFKGAWEKVKNVFSTGGKIFDGIKDGVVTSFKSIVNKIISGINTVVAVPFKAVNTALNKIRGVNILGITPFSGLGTISVPKIPMLAQGGYVKANTPQLAMIGDNKRYGEIVAPEDKMLEMVLTALRLFKQQEGNSNNVTSDESRMIELVVNIGGETLARKIIKLLKEQNRRGNKLEFDF